jgi:hypothetical protein
MDYEDYVKFLAAAMNQIDNDKCLKLTYYESS